jgi:hypothetical protein
MKKVNGCHTVTFHQNTIILDVRIRTKPDVTKIKSMDENNISRTFCLS